MIYFKDTYAKVWKIEDMGKYAQVQFSTSRKDKKSGEYLNSSWSYVNFVGDAYKKIGELSEGDRILIKSGNISKEPYMNTNNEKSWPKYPKLAVFDWEPAKAREEADRSDSPPVVEDDEENLPF
jgi:hypothetical protein